jgi:hypothetical protein
MKKGKFTYITPAILVLLSFILKGCCKSDPDYTSSTDYDPRINITVSSISTRSAVLEGKIKQQPNYTIIDCGFNWSTISHSNNYFTDQVSKSDFEDYIYFRDTLNGLNPRTIYYFTGFAKYTHPGSGILSQVRSAEGSFETLP